VCGTPSLPLPPLTGVKGGWEQKPSSISSSFFDVFVELQLPPGVDSVSFPLRDQSPPWPWAELDHSGGGLPPGLTMPQCTLGAPRGGPPALECPVRPGTSFFDIFTDINLLTTSGSAAPHVSGELWSGGKALGSFSVPYVPPACPAGYSGTPPNCVPPPPPPATCPTGYTGTPPNCVKFEGSGLFHVVSGGFVQYRLQFNQQTTAYEIQRLGSGQIVPLLPECSSQMVKNPNDAVLCTRETPANTLIEGQFNTTPPAENGTTKFEIYGFQGTTKFGPFGPFEAA
jgi:hypothetical protein